MQPTIALAYSIRSDPKITLSPGSIQLSGVASMSVQHFEWCHLHTLLVASVVRELSPVVAACPVAAAPWPSAETVPSPVRSGFSGHDGWLWMAISSKRRVARGGSHLGQRSSWEVVVAARDGGATPSVSVDDDGWLRCSFSLNKRSGSLAIGSSCFPKPSITVSNGGR
jgi:hypothetical protein